MKCCYSAEDNVIGGSDHELSTTVDDRLQAHQEELPAPTGNKLVSSVKGAPT